MIDIRHSQSQRVSPGVSVASPNVHNSINRVHALLLQRIHSLEDINNVTQPFKNLPSRGYTADPRFRFVRGS